MTTALDAEYEYVYCPKCGAPASIVDRWDFQGTDGPVEHVVIRCVDNHWFRMPEEKIERM